MKIDYILSETTKNATTLALSRLCDLAEQNPFENYIVIVPETKSIIIEREVLSLSKNGAFVNVFVYSFVRLINRLGLVKDENIANKQTSTMILRKVIYDNFKNLVCYKKTAKTSGFAEKIYETVSQFKSSDVSPDDLELSLETQNESLKQKLKDIVLIYRAYESALGDNLLDDCDKLSLLSKFSSQNDVIKNSHIFVVGFDNITFEMQSVLKNIAKNAKSITFSCVYFAENRDDKYIQDNELYKKFTKIADDLKYPYTPKFVKKYNSGDFFNIANHLFSVKPKVFEPRGNITVFEADSIRREVSFVASEILTEIKNGRRFKDIGVMLADEGAYLDDIEEIFSKNNIPYFVNKQHELGSHFFVKFLKEAFLCVNSNFSYDHVLSFISNPLFSAKNYSDVHQFVLESGINYSKFLADFDDKKYSKFSTYDSAKCELEKFRDFARIFRQFFKPNMNTGEYLEQIEFVQNYFSCKEKLGDFARFEQDSKLVIEAQITEKIYEKIEKYSAMMKAFMGDMIVEFDEFLLNYFSGIGSIRLNLLPVSVDSVVIQGDTDGFFDIKDLFILGAIEGSFPVSIKDSGIILDKEFEETKILSKKQIEPTVKQINKRENFRIYEALLEPKEKLFVCYCNKSKSGGEQKPARIVLRLLKLFGDKILKNSFEKFKAPSYEALEDEFLESIGEFFRNETSNNEVNLKFGALGKNISKETLKFLNGPNFVGDNFSLNDAHDLYFLGGKTSVSQLEKYFACPYLFFASYGLRLKENKTSNFSSLDIGLVIHSLAELFVKNIDSFNNLNAQDFEAEVLKLLNQAFDENDINTELNKGILSIVKNESVKLCQYLLFEHNNSSFKTIGGGEEFSFFGNRAFELALDDGQIIKIEGKIDRIDSFKDYIRIIDYKTGNVSSELSSVYFGKKIQLVSYLSAVSKLVGKNVAGLFYMPIHNEFSKKEARQKNTFKFEGFLLDNIDVVKNMDNNLSFEKPSSEFVSLKIKTNKKNINENRFEISGTSSKNLSEQEFENMKNYTEKLCAKAIEEILQGNIEPAPIIQPSEESPSMCEWCKFSGFCGKEQARLGHGRSLSGSISIKNFDLEGGDEK